MIILDSFHFLSLSRLVSYFGRPTASATLNTSPLEGESPQNSIAKRVMPHLDTIECNGPLPGWYPDDFPAFPNLLKMCSSREGHDKNLECACLGDDLVCGYSARRYVRIMIAHCLQGCRCLDNTTVVDDRFTKVIVDTRNPASITANQKALERLMSNIDPSTVNYQEGAGSSWGKDVPTAPKDVPTAPKDISTAPLPITHSCSNTCTSVVRGCPYTYTGECKCYAPPVGIFFWHTGDCGSLHDPDGLKRRRRRRRDLTPQNQTTYYINATNRYATPATAVAAELAYGRLPSPCNASYASFACSNSSDGIVHEPLGNLLGALLPGNGTGIPPKVPRAFLSLHGLEEGVDGLMMW